MECIYAREMNGKEINEMELSNLVWKQHGGNWMKSFYDNITIKPLF